MFPTELQTSVPPSWPSKLTKSTENCYNIQEGRVVDRGLKGRFISPIRIKNKNNSSTRSTSPAAQSITSIQSVLTSTPTHQSTNSFNSQTLNWRILQRDKLSADIFDDDKSEVKKHSEIYTNDERIRNKLSRTIGGYSIPYREKRNPLSSTRLSCYKPATNDNKFDISNLKNYKSVDDFLTLDKSELVDDLNSSMPFIASSKDLRMNMNEESNGKPKKTEEQMSTTGKLKKNVLSNKLKFMSHQTQKLFSRMYSSSNAKSNGNSSDVCNDFIVQRPAPHLNVINSRRSLSYGHLPGVNEFEIKKIEHEDGDSGILVNESGASSMVETDSNSDDAKTDFNRGSLLADNKKCERAK